MQKKTVLAAVVGLCLTGTGYWYFQTAKPVEILPVESATVSTSGNVAANDIRPADVLKRAERPSPEQLKANYERFMANRPPYLADVDLPAEYAVDENGNLIIDGAAKDILDYFMQGIGDIPFDQLHDLIAGNMHASLQEPALSQALELLDHYFAYIDSYDLWERNLDKETLFERNPQSMKAVLGELEALRRQHLGDDVYEAFYAEEAQTGAAYAEARAALQQPGLTDQEKADIAERLRQSLPESVRSAQEQAMTQVSLSEKTESLRSSGASDAQIYQARVEMVGEDAARRLQALDEEDRAWAEKRASYKKLVQGLSGTEGLSDEEKYQYVADLAQKELGLSERDLKRMQALDRIDAAESVQ